MNKNKPFGYFHVTIKSDSPHPLFSSNNERAFTISFLQQALSMRTIIESQLGRQSLAACIDLLAFSLVRSSCQLVVFGISRQSVEILCRRLCHELDDYTATYSTKKQSYHSTTITRLHGPHDALQKTIHLHRQHEDWEHDRYSSIGFYLHDRRGDWMRLWRLTQLYSCNPNNYRLLLQSALAHNKMSPVVQLHTLNA